MADAREARDRVRDVAPNSLRIFAIPLGFFVLSYVLASLAEEETIGTAVYWFIFITLAVVAFMLTLRVLDASPVLRRGHRLSAPALVIYLVAVRAALYANEEWGSAAFLAVFLATMVLLAVYSSIARREERPKATAYSDLTTTPALVPYILALNEVDRVERPILGQICQADDKGLDTSVNKLEKAAYVNVASPAAGVARVTPTSYLRRAAREYRRRNQTVTARPSWLKGKTN